MTEVISSMLSCRLIRPLTPATSYYFDDDDDDENNNYYYYNNYNNDHTSETRTLQKLFLHSNTCMIIIMIVRRGCSRTDPRPLMMGNVWILDKQMPNSENNNDDDNGDIDNDDDDHNDDSDYTDNDDCNDDNDNNDRRL